MASLANWLEVSKMRSNLTLTQLGAPLFNDLREQLQAAVVALSTGQQQVGAHCAVLS